MSIGQQIYFKFGVYTLYTLLSQQYKFHKDRASSLDVPVT